MNSTPVHDHQEASRWYTSRVRTAVQLQAAVVAGATVVYAALQLNHVAASCAQKVSGNLYLQVLLAWIPLYGLWTALSFPFVCYRFFVERRLALARCTVWQWLRVSAKAYVLEFAVLGAVLEIAFISRLISPTHGWFWAGSLYSMMLVLISPARDRLLLAYYPVAPLAGTPLSERLARLAEKAGTRIGAVYEWRVSRHFRHANAWVVGTGRSRRILVTDTLVENLSPEEVEALVAHELGHYVLHHTTIRLILNCTLGFAAFALIDQAVHLDLLPFADARDLWTSPRSIVGIIVLWWLISNVGGIVLKVLFRRQEKSADRYAWRLIPSVAPFITALRKLTELNLFEHDKGTEWQSTHPVTAGRICLAEDYAASHAQEVFSQGSVESAPRPAIPTAFSLWGARILFALALALVGTGIYFWVLMPEDWQAGLCIALLGLLIIVPTASQILVTQRKKDNEREEVHTQSIVGRDT